MEDGSSGGAFQLSDFLKPERCLILDHAAKEEVLETLAERLGTSPEVEDVAALADGIRAREELLSTGIGQGIAIPHVRLASIRNLVFAAALIRDGVTDYESPDSIPVRLVVMIVARADQHALYLRVLSQLSTRLKEEAFRNRVFGCSTAAELYTALAES